MANQKLPDLTELTSLATGDTLYAVDISDTTDGASGTSKRTLLSTITTYIASLAETLTNKTLTSPVINTDISGTAILDEDTMSSDSATQLATQQSIKAYVDASVPTSILTTSHYAPEGFLINGKIVPSVSSNNLTVAIKGMDGNDPSASNPVYVRIGGTVRTITAALSVTKNAGTNWCNSGSTELAAKETDYFVYLGYNATDGVVIGFSRIAHSLRYDGFSVTTTNEQYAAISTITTAAVSDVYVNIGRFAATLSAGAGYTWTVPSFTSVNLIQKPIYESRTLAFGADASVPGWAAGVAEILYYHISNNRVYIDFYIDGTSDQTYARITLPFTANTSPSIFSGGALIESMNNGTGNTNGCLVKLAYNSATVNMYTNMLSGAWTATGRKYVQGILNYII